MKMLPMNLHGTVKDISQNKGIVYNTPQNGKLYRKKRFHELSHKAMSCYTLNPVK